MAELNFGYGGEEIVAKQTPPSEPPTDINGDKDKVDANGNPIVEINDNGDNKDTKDVNDNKDTNNDNNDDNKETVLVPGTKLEIDDKTYTVDANGNVVDENGAIFKEAKDVNAWIKEFETTEKDDDKDFNLSNIIKAVDVEIVDEDGNPIQYDNTPEGVAAYVQDAIETGREEIVEATINTLYEKFPFVKPMIDYYIANNGSIEGFNTIPDRSNIEIDENNVNQQEAIIRSAWNESGRRGDVESYIDYLKNSGTLSVVAKEELQALKDADKVKREQLESKAKAEQQKQLEESQAYWSQVKQSIESKKLAGYQLPDNIIVERNGKKVSATLADFYNYIARNDKDGLTQYARDLMNESPQSRLEDDILRAYLKFTGGNYSNLVDLAINEQKVKTLQLRASQLKKQGTIRVTPPKKETTGNNNDYGY